MNKMELQKLKKVSYDNLLKNLFNALVGFTNYKELNLNILAVAAIIYFADQEDNQISIFESFQNKIKNDSTLYFLKDTLKRFGNIINNYRYKFSQEELCSLIIFMPFNDYADVNTPESINKLAIKLLNIQDNDRVIDFGAGLGSFLIESYMQNDKAKYDGIEINASLKTAFDIRNEVAEFGMDIYQGNFLYEDINNKEKYSKIFSNFPWGIRIGSLKKDIVNSNYFKDIIELSKDSGTADWIYIKAIIERLNSNGKAVVLTSSNALFNYADLEMRKYFTDNGLIETIISLPNKIYPNTNISINIIILSFNNKEIKMINAEELYKKGRRQNILTHENIDEIIELINIDSENSKGISLDMIEDNEYVLSPDRYLIKNEIELKNTIQFVEVIKNIRRGAPIKAKELDNLESELATNNKYLMLRNINNGLIDEELPFIKEIENKYERYLLRNGEILLSKIGFPFKVTVANIKENENIIANGNIYMIELDEEKVNPYYIQLFLESSTGAAMLKKYSVGSTMPVLSITQLNQIPIPMIPLEEQMKLVNKYLSVRDNIEYLKKKLSDSNDELKDIYNNYIKEVE